MIDNSYTDADGDQIDNGNGGGSGNGDTVLAGDGDETVQSGDGTLSGHATLTDGSVVNFSNIEQIVCFVSRTHIATVNGPHQIETLQSGDLVLTRDHGPQPVRWISCTTAPAVADLAPIQISRGQFGATRDLLVSPQHRMLYPGASTHFLFGDPEVLVAASHLINDHSIRRQPGGLVTYYHLLPDQHHIIYAEGAATESFYPGDQALSALHDPIRRGLFTSAPDLRYGRASYGRTARKCLSGVESSILTQ